MNRNFQMSSGKALAIGIGAAVLLAALAPLLGGNGGHGYAAVTQPALLFIAGLLALRVSLMYRTEMRLLFLSLGVFLALLGFVNVTPLVDRAAEALEGNFFRALLAYQLFTYLYLLTAVAMVLRVTGLARVNARGWIAMAAVAVLAAAIVARSLPTYDELAGLNGEVAAIYLVIRVLDVLAMVAIAPAVLLYVQSTRTGRPESLTFAVIGLGIACSLVMVYLYEVVSGDSLYEISVREFQQGSLLDALYIFGYAALAAGLFAHSKHQQWSLDRLDAVLSGRER